MAADLRMSLELGRQGRDWWSVPVIGTQATKGENIDELLEKTLLFLGTARETGELEKHRRWQLKKKLWSLLQHQVTAVMQEQLHEIVQIDQIVDDILAGSSDPYSASNDLFQKWRDSIS